MHIDRFYPRTMHRYWAVMDTNGKPHSLWIYRTDAQELEHRLADLSPVQLAYTPLKITKEERNS